MNFLISDSGYGIILPFIVMMMEIMITDLLFVSKSNRPEMDFQRACPVLLNDFKYIHSGFPGSDALRLRYFASKPMEQGTVGFIIGLKFMGW